MLNMQIINHIKVVYLFVYILMTYLDNKYSNFVNYIKISTTLIQKL